jgi:antitoxin (DNA-binding transcriptional repressor) of toxin-antitoxin stability system
MKSVTTHQAKTQLSRLLAEVEAGAEFVIKRGEVPVARLGPLRAGKARRTRPRVGTVTSEPVSYVEDAFAPLTGDELGDWGL